jgi:hypoxanthine phosphoribosyltransferase
VSISKGTQPVTQQSSPAQLLENSETIFTEAEVETVLHRLADEVTQALAHANPLVLCVMTGATVFAGKLLPMLHFSLEFDYVQATRYLNRTHGEDIVWKMPPGNNVRGRVVLLLDDILDEGHTLHAVREACLRAGAESVSIAVLAEKDTGREKPIHADFTGLTVPNRYVFGCGMDVHGWWRNLPEIRALK